MDGLAQFVDSLVSSSVRQLPLDLLGRRLLEVARLDVAGVVDQSGGCKAPWEPARRRTRSRPLRHEYRAGGERHDVHLGELRLTASPELTAGGDPASGQILSIAQNTALF